MKPLLEISNLVASIDEQPILKGMSLTLMPGEVHVIMGPNGAGKSTLAKLLAGDPDYDVNEGRLRLEDQDLLDLDPEERSHAGLFVSFQYPVEVPGVVYEQFLRAAYQAKGKAHGLPACSNEQFQRLLEEKLALLGMRGDFLSRGVNQGFSGGEKKRSEILQMALLEPKVAVLDETDSGLDIDAMRIVGEGVARLATEERSLLVITHYPRLLEWIVPTHVHVMLDGRIVHSGGAELAYELERSGYDRYQVAL